MDLEKYVSTETNLVREEMSISGFYKVRESVIPCQKRSCYFKKQVIKEDKDVLNMESYVKYSKIYRSYAEIDLLNLEFLDELL